jgi:V-type H+-transporting ATPase subunit a
MERQLNFLENEIKKEDIIIDDIYDFPPALQPREIIDLQATLHKLEGELKEANSNYEILKQNLLELTELSYVLKQTQGIMDSVSHIMVT